MWPMLLELLPHLTRLMPAADKYLANRGASDKALESSLTSLNDTVRGQMRHVVEEQAGIRSQLQEQSVQVAEVAVEVTRVRMGVESLEERVARLEKATAVSMRLLAAALVLLAMVSALVVVLLFKVKAH